MGWEYEFPLPLLDIQSDVRTQTPGHLSRLTGVDGRYIGRLRRFPGFAETYTIDRTVGADDVQMDGASTSYRFPFSIQYAPGNEKIVRGILFLGYDNTAAEDVLYAVYSVDGGAVTTSIIYTFTGYTVRHVDATTFGTSIHVVAILTNSPDDSPLELIIRYNGSTDGWGAVEWRSKRLNVPTHGLSATFSSIWTGTADADDQENTSFLVGGKQYGLVQRIVFPDQGYVGPLMKPAVQAIAGTSSAIGYQYALLRRWADYGLMKRADGNVFTSGIIQMFRTVDSSNPSLAVGSLHLETEILIPRYTASGSGQDNGLLDLVSSSPPAKSNNTVLEAHPRMGVVSPAAYFTNMAVGDTVYITVSEMLTSPDTPPLTTYNGNFGGVDPLLESDYVIMDEMFGHTLKRTVTDITDNQITIEPSLFSIEISSGQYDLGYPFRFFRDDTKTDTEGVFVPGLDVKEVEREATIVGESVTVSTRDGYNNVITSTNNVFMPDDVGHELTFDTGSGIIVEYVSPTQVIIHQSASSATSITSIDSAGYDPRVFYGQNPNAFYCPHDIPRGLKDDSLALQPSLDPEIVSTFDDGNPSTKFIEHYDGVNVRVTTSTRARNVAGVDVIRWGSLDRSRHGIIPILNRRGLEGNDSTSKNLVRAGTYLVTMLDNDIIRLHLSGGRLAIDTIHNRYGASGRYGTVSIGSTIYSVSPVGVLVTDLNTGQVTVLNATQHYFDEDGRWADDLADIQGAYDSRLGCLFFLNATKAEILCVWLNHGVLTHLSDMPYDQLFDGVDFQNAGVRKAFFVINPPSVGNDGHIYTVDAYRDETQVTTFGSKTGSGRLNGVAQAGTTSTMLVTASGSGNFGPEIVGHYVIFLDANGDFIVRGKITGLTGTYPTYDTLSPAPTVGDRYSIGAIPFKITCWPLSGDPDQPMIDLFRNKMVRSMGVALAEVSGETTTANPQLKVKYQLFERDPDTAEQSSEGTLDATENAVTFTAIERRNPILIPGIENWSSDLMFDLLGIFVRGTIEKSRRDA